MMLSMGEANTCTCTVTAQFLRTMWSKFRDSLKNPFHKQQFHAFGTRETQCCRQQYHWELHQMLEKKDVEC